MELGPSIDYVNRIENRSVPLEQAVQNIVDRHTQDLSTIIHKIRTLLKDDTDQLTDLEIDDILLQLPIVLYDITDDQEVVGLQADLASQIYKESYNEAYKIARGTVGDKTSVAELNTMIQKLDSQIYDRAYKTIKQKISLAIETLNSVKKVRDSRAQRYDMRPRTF